MKKIKKKLEEDTIVVINFVDTVVKKCFFFLTKVEENKVTGIPFYYYEVEGEENDREGVSLDCPEEINILLRGTDIIYGKRVLKGLQSEKNSPHLANIIGIPSREEIGECLKKISSIIEEKSNINDSILFTTKEIEEKRNKNIYETILKFLPKKEKIEEELLLSIKIKSSLEKIR
ncbi:MAG: hypothetical protein PHU61_00670 [Candidatus Absconditabacteria bacterium]|nr:hypothetical protein [Candidatus Absconditabacteria bacterium]MDD3868521.1 hypothetical protein [Candidatus Absconditabacteria bacterium]MDD4714085.1 hypothetical protein [Candidatus Absconditabacteria bacterium]